jgi:CRISPR/Cas system CSM-associated protein Csm5 (group 7 of RAMP superfamily)
LTPTALVAINLERVVAGNPQRTEDLNRRLERDALHFSLADFLTPEEQANPAIHRYSASIDNLTKLILQEELRKGDGLDVAVCLKIPVAEQVYIPGSALKGAFRTALAYAVLQADATLFNVCKQRLEQIDWRQPDRALNELIFWGAGQGPQADFLKTLQFSDSSALPATEQTLAIGKLKTLSLTAAPKKDLPKQGTLYKQLEHLRATLAEQLHSPLKPGWTLQEVVKIGTTFTGTLALDERLLRDAQAQRLLRWNAPHQANLSTDQLLRAANTFAADICDWELRFFEQRVAGIDVAPVVAFYRNLRAYIKDASPDVGFVCLGQGGGWHKLTIGMLLERDPTFNFKRLRRDLQLADDRLSFEFPKSRKLLMTSATDIQGVLGWVKVEFS